MVKVLPPIGERVVDFVKIEIIMQQNANVVAPRSYVEICTVFNYNVCAI